MAGEVLVSPDEVAQTEKIGLGDFLLAVGLAALTFVFQRVWEFSGLLPNVWDEMAVAAGVRPATHLLPGFLTLIGRAVYGAVGIGAAPRVLNVLGHAVLAVDAILLYYLLREILAFVLRVRPQYSTKRTLVMRLASALGTFAFVVSDPVWRAGQCLSEGLILITLVLLASDCFFLFLRKGEIKYAHFCAILSGIMAAETPLGLVLPLLFIALNAFIMNVVPTLEASAFRPAVIEVGKWHLTFLFLFALLFGMAVNVGTFFFLGGFHATGQSFGTIPLLYLQNYWALVASAAGVGGWIFWFGICVLPFIVTLARFPAASDEAHFLAYGTGIVFFICGLVAFSQCAALPALWFWTYMPVDSDILQLTGNLLIAITLAAALTTLGVDSFCRNHRKLADILFGAENEDDDGEARPRPLMRTITASRSASVLQLFGLLFIVLALIVLAGVGRPQGTAREMLRLVQDALDETVREAEDARVLFSDGNLDTGLELASAKAGGALKCFSLMGGSDATSVFLRTRGITDSEDLFSFRFDSAMGLRSWIRDRPERLKTCAAQLGFDLWKRDGKKLPPMGGLLSRPAGFASEDERVQGVRRAHRLIDRVFAVRGRRGGLRFCTNPRLKRAFLDVQWRLGRMCRYRSETDDLSGRSESALAEVALAKRLDEANEIFEEILKSDEAQNQLMLQKLTPREGLQLALVRADFSMGRVYAEQILEADPENADACFAMGMFYLRDRQLSRAETYLRRCLIQRPREPAVYNNLAMIQIEQGRLDAAESNIRKALEILPDSAVIRETEKRLKKARAGK